MGAKTDTTFHAVPVSDGEDLPHHDTSKEKFYVPPGTRSPALIALLCLILVFIALLQTVVSKSVNYEAVTYSSANLSKRQVTISLTQVYTGFAQTITGTTITWLPTTATFPSRTITYSASTQTITGTTESLPGSTSVVVEIIQTTNGTPITGFYAIKTVNGTVTSIPIPGATPSSAYLDTSVPTTTIRSSPVIKTTDSMTNPSSTFPSTFPSTSSTMPSALPIPQIDRIISDHYTDARYFIANYLCSLCVVLLKGIAGFIFASTKLVEPFYQLRRPGGANAQTSLLADFLSSSLSMSSIFSLSTSSPVLLIATIVLTVSTLMAPIASESMGIRPSWLCPQDDGTFKACAPVWVLNIACIRILQAFLGLLFCLLMAYLFFNHNRSSGVFANPSSIASITSLLGNDGFVQSLRNMPPNASRKDIKKLLKGKRYALGKSPNSSGASTYGIYEIFAPQEHNTAGDIKHGSSRTKIGPSKSGYLQDIVLFLLSIGVLALVLAYALDNQGDAFNNFFNSNTFGPRFVLSALAVLLDNRWRRLEYEVRLVQPFRDLYSRSPASSTALLTGAASSPYTSLPLALWRKHFFLALVAWTAILGDVLIIAIVGVPFNDVERYVASRVSAWLGVSVLSTMVMVSVLAMVWRRGNPPLPQEPNSIVSIASYVCASHITDQLVSTSTMNDKMRDENFKSLNQSLWYGYGQGQDGKLRWLVDNTEGGDL